MKRHFFLICIVCLLGSIQVFPQSYNFVNGKVINSLTREPLLFASIVLKNNNLGVFSNSDGDFKLANNPNFQSDSLIITYIGYKRKALAFKSLREDKVNTIYLTPDNYKLNEIDVVASAEKIDSKAIIRKAIKNITENYPEKPFNYISYYRDYQKKDKSYFNLNEAIVQTLDTGINVSSTSNKFRLLDFKQNKDFQRMELSPYYDFMVSSDENANKYIKYGMLPDQGGNELFILMIHDPIRNFQTQTFSFVNTLAKNFVLNHNFSKPSPVYSNNLMLYKISFTAKPYLTGDSLIVSGDIFIQPLTFSIHKLNYSGYYLLKGNERKKMYDVDIEYGPANSDDPKMQLKYISFNNIFNVVDKADTTHFRMVNYELDPLETTNSKVTLRFNHVPDSISASNKDLYEVAFKDKTVKIKLIKVVGKTVQINLFPEETHTLSPNLTVQLGKIKDTSGKILDRKKKLEFYQYRELFVQEFNQPIAFNESCYLKNVPLVQNCISKYVGDQKYWMNTPVNADTLKPIFSDGYGKQITDSGEEDRHETIMDKLHTALPIEKSGKTVSNLAHVDSLIEKHLNTHQKSTGNDHVFVHLDRNIYRPGDTIYFQAYIRDQFTGTFESKSQSMYALLFNANQMMIDSARYRINNATASGWMAIPEKAESGKYHFTAFTGQMQNYDPAEAFQLDIYVKERNNNSNKIGITFDKEKYKPGDTLVATIKITDPSGNPVTRQKCKGSLFSGNTYSESEDTQTNQWGMSLIRFTLPDSIQSHPRFKVLTRQDTDEIQVTREVSIPYTDPYFELRFLPEGGTFIEGLRQRVGFNATNFKGQPEPIVGVLKDSSGTLLDTIKSGIYGPGYFSCIAKPGLYVELIKGFGSEKIWPLPDPSNGISIRVSPVGERSFAVDVQANSYNNQQVTLWCIMNTTQILSKELILDKQKRVIVGTDELPSGVAQITLFDNEIRPLAQRLIYVNADKHLTFNIKTDSIYQPEQETELAVSVTDGQGNPVEGIFSVAVTDSLRGIDSELFAPGIEYAFNYHPQLAGNLPAKVLAKGLENLTNEERDLLFMVYGWSKINWDFSREKADDQQLTNYDLLNMKVLYASKSRRADRKLDLVSLEGPSIKHLTTNGSGEIALPLDSLTDITRTVTLMPVVKDKSSALGAMLSIPYNEQYFKSKKLLIPQPSILPDEYKIKLPDQFIPLDEKTIELEEVTVIEHKREKKVYHDKYEEEYQYARVRSLDYELLWSSSNLEAAIRKLVTPYRITNESIILRPSLSFLGGEIPALIVLDGMPIMTGGWSRVCTISPYELTSLTILHSVKGITRYGSAAQGGVIFVNTRSSDPNLLKIRSNWIAQNSNDKMLVPIEIYRPFVEFYRPTKRGDDINPIIQNRATVFWESEVYFDGKEPVKIKYSNLKRRGPVSITINGVSFTDLMGTGKASYLIQ